jgi:hypothetical protein
MSTRDERLGQFFGGYFNQDWDAGGASSWQEVLVDYVEHASKDHVSILLQDLRSWAAEAATMGVDNLPTSFYCEYDPRPDGQTDRQWVEEMANAIEKQLAR